MKAITGLPALLAHQLPTMVARWNKIAFANSTNSRIDLYVADVAAHLPKVSSIALNATLAAPYHWISDSKV